MPTVKTARRPKYKIEAPSQTVFAEILQIEFQFLEECRLLM
ncbi:hypothetical protein LEP1GSC061_3944 [Leptospira wolffii serovar Khorat str. Khorat-H2]|nr:hypothetical protein LEP1GSC061_3944 [Leptospira wolffii serovar Khorat str. Khorat-H2]